MKVGKAVHYFKIIGRNSVGDPLKLSLIHRGNRNRCEADLFINR